jgi:hypothetical protein
MAGLRPRSSGRKDDVTDVAWEAEAMACKMPVRSGNSWTAFSAPSPTIRPWLSGARRN